MTRTVAPGPRTGAVQIPASKSQAHRMLICAALSEAPSRLELDGFSADIEATVQCLEALGAQLTQETAGLLITPIGARPANAKLDVGESGSTLRFLLPVLGALGIRAEIQMHGRLPERPLSPLWEVLEAHGMQLQQDGAVLHTAGQLCAGDYSLPGNVSSQFISGLLFALPLLSGNSTLTVTGALQSARYVAMTEQALAEAGILIKKDGPVWQIGGEQRYAAPSVQTVEGDWSNAAFFLCMGALSEAGVTVTGLNPESLQADRAITEILTRFGAKLAISEHAVIVRRGNLHGITLDAGPVPDLIPVVSCLAALCSGETQIENAARLRLKESDRVASVIAMVEALGGKAQASEDTLTVYGTGLVGGTVDAMNDHRIAMSAAIAATACKAPVAILGVECVGKSYPKFFEEYARLGGNYEQYLR